MKWLIVNGDDFGASRGINSGILQAHREGILTSASVMVDGAASAHACAAARQHRELSLGLHLELSADHAAHVGDELDRQLQRFVDLTGRPPTHVDSHHDAHLDPRLLPAVLSWARREGLPVRGRSAARRLSRFYGQWGGHSHPEQIGVAGLLRLLDTAMQDGVTELICHPGFVEPDFASSYRTERELEVRTLCDPVVRLGLLDRGIQLLGFRDLPRGAAAPVVEEVG